MECTNCNTEVTLNNLKKLNRHTRSKFLSCPACNNNTFTDKNVDHPFSIEVKEY